ncbi:MAG: alpha/beta hydrolase [Alkalispirochaetaceae bacterium]
MKSATFTGSEGKIFYRSWEPHGPCSRIVVLVHGYAEHGGRYAHVAERLASVGSAVYAPDHIGHGESAGERAKIGDFEHVVDDLRSLVAIAIGEYGEKPLIMIGHSMGGLLTARYAERYPETLAGVGFLGAVLGDWNWAREVLAAPELPKEPSDPSGMSRDPETVRAYAADPLVYHGGYKRELLEAEVVALDRFNEEIEKLTMPVLFLHGDADPFVPAETTAEAVKRMPAKEKRAKIYPGAKHELVNELNREEVLREIESFVTEVGE